MELPKNHKKNIKMIQKDFKEADCIMLSTPVYVGDTGGYMHSRGYIYLTVGKYIEEGCITIFRDIVYKDHVDNDISYDHTKIEEIIKILQSNEFKAAKILYGR